MSEENSSNNSNLIDIEESILSNAEQGNINNYSYSQIPTNLPVLNLTQLPTINNWTTPTSNLINTTNIPNLIGNSDISSTGSFDDFDDMPELVEDDVTFQVSSSNLIFQNYDTNLLTTSLNLPPLPPINEGNIDENSPFADCLIKPLEFDINDEFVKDKNILLTFSWVFELNYDFYSIKYINIYTDNKNTELVSKYNRIKQIRSNRNQRTETGEILKLNNSLKLKKNDEVWIYLIIYYDNIKCNIEFYGIFRECPDEEILKKNIIEEKTYGNTCNIININKTSINSNGFNLLPYKVKIL